ncbi:unnamed protein product, partial [Prunus brigantina]
MKWTKVLRTGALGVRFMDVDLNTIMTRTPYSLPVLIRTNCKNPSSLLHFLIQDVLILLSLRCCFKLLYAIVVLILLHMNNPCIGCSERERQALLALKQGGLVCVPTTTIASFPTGKAKIAANGMESTAATKLAMLLSLNSM